MTPVQCQEARALAEVSQEGLSAISGVSVRTVVAFGAGTAEPYPRTIMAIRAGLEAAGVVFLPENGIGPTLALRGRASDAQGN